MRLHPSEFVDSIGKETYQCVALIVRMNIPTRPNFVRSPGSLCSLSKHMVARFVQVQAIAVFKRRWAGWICFLFHVAASYFLSTILISSSVNPYN
jgi:hypothetical protein